MTETNRAMWRLLANFELPLDHETRCQVANAYKNLIEQHEAFRQEVSDALEVFRGQSGLVFACFNRFVIPKPDPLVEALASRGFSQLEIDRVEEALAARGLEVREIEQ